MERAEQPAAGIVYVARYAYPRTGPENGIGLAGGLSVDGIYCFLRSILMRSLMTMYTALTV